MTYRKNILALSILFGLSAVAACKKAATSKTKDAAVGCSNYQAEITQAEKDLKSRNAPIPADDSPAAAGATPAPDDGYGLGLGGRDCNAEGVTAWNNCMAQKCFAYSQSHPGGVFVAATDCTTPAAVISAKVAGKINDSDFQCSNLQLKTTGDCNQQNTASSALTYVCVTSVSSITGKPLYKWREKSDAVRNNQSYLVTPVKVVQAGSTEAQALNDTECANAATPQNGGNDKNTADGVTAAQNAKDIARFTENLKTARANLKACVAAEAAAADKKKRDQDQQTGAGGGGDGTAPTPAPEAKKCAAPDAGPYDGEGQYRPGGSCIRKCADGYYAGADQRCYPKPASACDAATQYVGTDGKCHPLGTTYKPGTETSCPAGQVLTNINTCVPDSNYSQFSGNEAIE